MLLFACSTKKTYKINSPGKVTELIFELTPSGQPQYSFSKNGKSVIEPSLLGFEFQGIQKMTEGFEVVSTEEKSADETWEQPWGEFKKVRDHHNELIVHLKESKGEERLVDIIFRTNKSSISLIIGLSINCLRKSNEHLFKSKKALISLSRLFI